MHALDFAQPRVRKGLLLAGRRGVVPWQILYPPTGREPVLENAVFDHDLKRVVDAV